MSKRHRPTVDSLLALTREDGQLIHDAKGNPVELPRPLAPLADTHGHLTHFHQHGAAMTLARASLAGVALLGVPVDPTDDGRDPSALLDRLDRWTDDAAALIDELVSCGVQPAGEDAYALLDHVYLFAGVHPYGGAGFNASAEAHEALLQLLASPRTVGVGEIGLDYGPYNRCDPHEQQVAFAEQLRRAHELGIPVELHLRDAEGDAAAQAHVDAARILEREGVPAAGCDLHCFTSDARVMQPFVDMGCYVAFGGAATFARSEDIRGAAAACPSQLMLSETDSPYMAPLPLRGFECEPAMVALTVGLVADVRAEAGVQTRSQTYQALWDNACRFMRRA